MKVRKLLCFSASLAALLFSNATFSKSELVQINNERKIFMNCEGEGSPTVMLIAGWPDRGDSAWNIPAEGKKGPTVFSAVSKFTKVCEYDRPGTLKIIGTEIIQSRSTPVPQPTSAEDVANDLHALVNAANIEKPFIIVAHSGGGLGARLYAMKFPEDVSGLILIDPTNEKLFKEWSKKEIEVFKYGSEVGPKELYARYKDAEKINFAKSFDQLNQYQNQKLSIPTIILAPRYIPDAKKLVKEGIWPKFVTQEMAVSIVNGVHRSLVDVAETFNPKAKLIDVQHSGHYVQKDQSELVIKLIKEMVEQQRVS